MSTSIDERVSGLPADLEEGNSLNEENPSLPTGLDSQRHSVEPLFAGASVIRAAIMDVIDVTEWRLYEGRDNGRYVQEDVATAERGAFADAVEKRIRELQSPPFSLGTKIENYCPRHIRERLPASTATVCADCMAEREEKK